MRPSLWLLLLAVALAATEVAGRSLSQVQAAIVSGRAAPKGRYKWIASLRAKGSDFHFCTGSLIAPRVVMTAAHCVTNSYAAWADLEQSLPDVRIGGWEYRGGRYERRAAVQAVVHEAFNPATLENDIALLLLDRPAAAAPVLLPANSFPSKKQAYPQGTVLTVAGWGVFDDNYNPPPVLQETTVNALDPATCQDKFEGANLGVDFLRNSMICAANLTQHPLYEDTCYGDSGGPLFYAGGIGNDTVVGLTSWGETFSETTCFSRYPSVYTDVAFMRGWIDAHVQALLKANGSAPVVDLGPASTAPSASRARLPGKTALSRRLGDSPADNAGQMYACNSLQSNQGCRYCDASGRICKECALGFRDMGAGSLGRSCKACSGGSNCLSCGQDLRCTACSTSNGLDRTGSCSKCSDPLCFTCNGDVRKCSQCIQESPYGGVWRANLPGGSRCTPCLIGCLRCTSLRSCQQCASGMASLGAGACFRCVDPRCGECPTNPNQCTACRAPGYVARNGRCVRK